MSNEIGKILSHPLILNSAWERIKSWYITEWRPEPEYSHWCLNPEEHLLQLGEELASNKFLPSPFRLIPYPKRGATLRHYSIPSVKDQVAFSIFGILLAPILESRIPNFVFGNRWFRGVFWDRVKTKWKNRPFGLTDHVLYQPYRRDHGLYLRVCHWSAARMLGAEISEGLAGRPAIKPENYDSNRGVPAYTPFRDYKEKDLRPELMFHSHA